MKTEEYKDYDNLVEILEDLIKAYRLLLDIVRREKDILVLSDIEQLAEINRTKEAVLKKIETIERLRQQTVTRLAKKLGLSVAEVSLRDLANTLGGARQDRLYNLHSVLELLLKRVKELNDDNEVLVMSAQRSLKGALASLKEALQEKPVYAKKGSLGQGPTHPGSFMDREI